MTTYERVGQIIADVLGIRVDVIKPTSTIAGLTPETPLPSASSQPSFIDDLGADSLNRIEISLRLEEAFDLEISDETIEPDELHTGVTVQDIVDYIELQQKR